MHQLYSLLIWLLIPLLLLRIYWRGFKAPAYRERWRERLGYLPGNPPGSSIWLHMVSVGEVQAASLLVKQLLKRYPQLPLVISTTTPTGAQRVQELFGNEVHHYYAPFDACFIVRRFLTHLNPVLLILMETEIWPNLIHEAKGREIPVLLANARLSVRSSRRYHRLAGLTRETLRKITLIAPHGEADAQRFQALGARSEQVEVTGSIKFDIHLPASLRERADVLRRQWGMQRPVWLAASTHNGEEELLLQAHARIRQRLPTCLLVLVPRHPERFDQVAELVRSAGFDMVRRSVAQGCASVAGAWSPGATVAQGRDRSYDPSAFPPSLEVRRDSVPRRDAQMPQEAGGRERPAGAWSPGATVAQGRDYSDDASAFPRSQEDKCSEGMDAQEQPPSIEATSAGIDSAVTMALGDDEDRIGVFLGDTMGELTLFMGAADAAFIGGSLVPHGGHNILEAAAQGVPVVFGPYMFNFTEISEMFLENQAAVRITSADELAQLLVRWLTDASERSLVGENGRRLVERNRGALERLLRLVDRVLNQRNS